MANTPLSANLPVASTVSLATVDVGSAVAGTEIKTEVTAKIDVDVDVDLTRRFGGLERLYGSTGAAAIRAAHVVVVGIGGVGSWAAEALARSGVGRLTLIDLDHIAESNINRQSHALTCTIGQAKVQAMHERIAQINPACQVHCIEDFVEPSNWPALLHSANGIGPVHGVVDACDSALAKTAMAAWARTSKILFICAGAAGGKRLAHKVDIADLAQVTHEIGRAHV